MPVWTEIARMRLARAAMMSWGASPMSETGAVRSGYDFVILR